VARFGRTLLLAGLLAVATGAGAHAVLDRSDPRDGGTVHVAPREVTLVFTERLEPAYSSVRVLDESSRPVDRGDSRVDRANPTTLRVSLTPLPSGTYTARWRVLSIDSHITEGTVTFRVSLR
jgi:hypothetical protein